MSISDDEVEAAWLRDTAMNVMLATEVAEAERILSLALRAAAKVRAIREGDGEWDILARAACRVAWPNFNAFGTESKSKRMQEMREAMIAASPIPATGGEKE